MQSETVAPVPPPRRRNGLVFRPLAQEWVVFDPSHQRLHVLNLTAALVWNQMDGVQDVSALTREVWDAFARKPDLERVRTDVEVAIKELGDKGLLA